MPAVNEISGSVKAYIANSTNTTVKNAITITAKDEATIRSLAGQVAVNVSTSSWAATLGAAIAINDISNLTVNAYIEKSKVVSTSGGLTIDAQGKGIIESIAAGVQVGVSTSSFGGAVGASVAFNEIDNAITKAYISNSSHVTTSGKIQVKANNENTIKSLAGQVSVGVSVSGVGIAAGAAVAINKISNEVSAYIDASTVTSNSAEVELKAKLKSIIETLSAGVHVGAGGGSFGGAIGASVSVNQIDKNITEAYISGGSTVTASKAITINAKDDESIIKSLTGEIAVGIGLAGGGGAIGAAIARNQINNNLQAYILDSTVASDGDLQVSSINKATIIANSTAVAVAVALTAANQTGISLSGGGAESTNVIIPKINAYIQGSMITSGGDVDIQAIDTSSINADVLAAAITATRGLKDAGGVAIGASFSTNLIGWEASFGEALGPVANENNDAAKAEVQAYIKNSKVEATRNLYLTALANGTIEAGVDAVAVGLAGGAGNAGQLSGAGVRTENRIRTQIKSFIDGTVPNGKSDQGIITADSANLIANDTSKITANALSAAVAASFGADNALGGTIGVSLALNEVLNEVEAYIKKETVTVERAVVDQVNYKEQILPGVTIVASGNKRYQFLGRKDGDLLLPDKVDLSAENYGDIIRWEDVTDKTTEFDVTYQKTASYATKKGRIKIEAKEDATITATVTAASIAIAGSGKISISLSGGGAEAVNIIGTNTNAYIIDSTVTSKGEVTLDSRNTSLIDAEVLAVSGSVGIGGTGGVAAAIGASIAHNFIGFDLIGFNADGTVQIDNSASRNKAQIQAYVEDSTVKATTGDIRQTAISHQTITAEVWAGSVAISGGSQGALSLSGAGVSTVNKIATQVKTYIDGAVGSRIEASNILLTAQDTSKITAKGGAAALAVAVAGEGSGSVAIGVALAENTIANTVASYITNSPTVIARDQLSLTAKEAATVEATTIAASLSVSISALGVGLTGAGANATNIINNKVHAYIDNSNSVMAQNNVLIDAQSEATITSLVGAASVAGGTVGAGAIGVSLARNLIGLDGIGDTSPLGNEVLAYVKNSTLTSNQGNITVQAKATDKVDAVSFAGSVAIAGGILAAAGAGAEVTNKMASKVHAYLENTKATAGVDIKIKAISDSQVTKAHAVGAAIAGVLGGGAVSVAVSQVVNEITNSVQAYIKSNTAKTIQATTGNVLISADVERARISNVTAVTTSVAVDVSGGLFAFAGGGVGLYNTINNDIDAYITGPVTVTSGTNLDVLAAENAYLSSDATVVSIAASIISAALGGAIVKNEINSSIQAWIDSDSVADNWTSGTPITTTINSVNTAVYVESIADIDKTLTAGVSGGAVGGVVNIATGNIAILLKAFVEGTKLTSTGDIDIRSAANTRSRTSSNGGAIGLGALGAMESNVTLGKGNDVDEVQATIGDGTQVTANALRIAAVSTDDLLAESVAASGGAIAVAGAQSNVTTDFATLAKIGNNTAIVVDNLYITSSHDQNVDSSADSFTLAALAGTGAGTKNLITSKANVNIGTSTSITADNVIINAINRVSKEETAGKPSLIAASASGANVTVLTSGTDIGTSDNPFQAVVNIGSGTNITVNGTNAKKGVLKIETLNQATAVDNVRIETVGGYSLAVGLSRIDAETNAAINLNGATLENKSGDVYLTTRTDTGLRPSANLLSVTAFGGVAAGDAKTTTNAKNQITVDNATVKGSDIYLFTGRDSFAVPNLLDSSANAEITTVSFGPGLSIPVLKAEINETNKIDIKGASKIRALGDVSLVAKEGLGGNKRAATDGLVLNLSALPYGFNVPDGSSVSSSNQIEVGRSVSIEAGINNKTVVQIKPISVGGTQQLDPAKLGHELIASEKTALGLDQETNYEYAELDLAKISFSISTGTVVQAIANAYESGTAGHYYKYKPLTKDGADSIILETQNYTNTLIWEDLGTSPNLEDLTVYTSDVTNNLKSTLENKFYVVKPVELDDITMSYAGLGSLLLEQREKIQGWINSHSGNSEAVARYQVQLDAINQAIADSGLIDPESATVQKEIDLLFINLPNIYAAPGSIFIEADRTSSTAFTPLISNNQLIARGGAEIKITNQSPFTLNVNDAVIRDNKRVRIVDGQYTVLQPGNVYLNNALISNAVNNTGAKNISIVQDAYPNSQYDTGSLVIPSVDQDIYILGDVINESGNLLIDNKEGSINVSGEIKAENVTINAASNFNLNTDDWFHSNQDPRQYLDYDRLRQTVYNPNGIADSETYNSATNVNGQNLETAINRNQSRILSQGPVTITARYLNVNGLIQSGVSTIELDIAATFNPGKQTRNFVDDNGNVLAGISFGTENVPVDGYFDVNQQAIILNDIVPKGGEITLAGQIFSTGNGQLKVANGYTNVDINNQSIYQLILNRIDTTTNRQGKITILDTETLKKVQYTVDANNIKTTKFDGVYDSVNKTVTYTATGTPATNSFTDDIKYQTPLGRQYVWTEGQEKTQVEVRKYEKKSFNLFGFDWDALVADDSYTWKTVEFRDEKPLLESESLVSNATTILPAYTIEYQQVNDSSVDLIKNVSEVRNVANNKVYRYIGDNDDLVLSTQDFTDTDKWTEIGTNLSSITDRVNNKFDSNYVNSSTKVENWTTGGGWLRKKTLHTRTTTITGLKDFYTNALKADYPIDIDFIQGPDKNAAQISITSNRVLYLQGDIESPNSKVSLIGSSINSNSSSVVYANTIDNADVQNGLQALNFKAQSGGIDLKIQGGLQPVNATAVGDINLTIVSLDNINSNLVAGNIASSNGTVTLNAPQGITAGNSSSLISGKEIKLETSAGALGSTTDWLRVDSGTRGIGAKAQGDIYIREIAGDLNLNAIVTPADIYLESVQGSIFDHLVEGSSISSSEVSERAQELFDAESLKYPLSAGLYSFLYPNANLLRTTPTAGNTEGSNIIGRNVTIKAQGQLGQVGNMVAIDLSGGFNNLATDKKKTLSSASVSDVVGVSYATYKYLGSDDTDVDLTQANFSNTSLWEKLQANFVTGTNKSIKQEVSLATYQTVLVQYNAVEYGLYKYLGQNQTLDLGKQIYGDTTLWQKLTANHGSDGVGNVNLIQGELVQDKSVVESLTLQLTDDIDIEITNITTIDAGDAVAVQAAGTLNINHVNAGGDVRLQAGGSIIDNYAGGSTAAITTTGDLLVVSQGTIAGTTTNTSFRIDLSGANSQLSAESLTSTYIRQVTNTSLSI
ncbi:hypothetical protein, partial [Aphanizomenon sp. UHCC 0183]|uniref:hypothetical protein n=1 Tax=Aphanizomenon sp. UHCC 0183 TaxID=2590028 RepID=UPI001446E561